MITLILSLLFLLSSTLFAQDATFNAVNRANRRVNAKAVRTHVVNTDAQQALQPQLTNGDEQRYADKRASYGKALNQLTSGLIDPAAFAQLVFALRSNNQADFNAITMGTSPAQRKLVDPQAAFAFNLDGADGWIHSMPPAPALASAEAAGEMVEVYWHALLRDVPFNRYLTSDVTFGTSITAALADLNKLSDFKGPKVNGVVTEGTLFKGNTPGDLVGPHVSQFLYLPVPYGPAANFDGGVGGTPGIDFQAQDVPIPGFSENFMTNFTDWSAVQKGERPTATITFAGTRIFIRTARDLGDYVHQDMPNQEYENAARILLNFGADALDANNPYLSNPTQESFVTYSGPDIMYMVTVASEVALRTAFYQKWLVHRRIRPEFMAFLVNQQITGVQDFGLNNEVINSTVVSLLFGVYGNYFLPLAYPEGSPTHPSYPAAHATIAGASVTVLKAFFNENFVIPAPLQPNAANSALEAYTGAALTVGGELNKLASNIALARDYAGVHYRSDGWQGMLLGEKVAIALLNDESFTRNIPFSGYSLTKFDGTKITIGAKQNTRQLG